MAAARNSGSRRNADRGWQHGAAGSRHASGHQPWKLALTAIMALAVLAAIGIFLFQSDEPPVLVMAGGVDQIQDPAFPLNGFGSADENGWQEAVPLLAPNRTSALDYESLQNWLGSRSGFEDNAQNAAFAGKNLVVSLSGHLLAEKDGTSLLLTSARSNQLFTDSGDGKIKLRDLLEAFEQTDADNVLVFFNATRLRPDWQLGIFTAEARGQLQRDLQDWKSEKVTFVACTDPLGLNFEAGSTGGHSLLAAALTNALLNGSADQLETDKRMTNLELLDLLQKWAGPDWDSCFVHAPAEMTSRAEFCIARTDWRQPAPPTETKTQDGEGGQETVSESEAPKEAASELKGLAKQLADIWTWASDPATRAVAFTYRPAAFRRLHKTLLRYEQKRAARIGDEASADGDQLSSNDKTFQDDILAPQADIQHIKESLTTDVPISVEFARAFPGFAAAVVRAHSPQTASETADAQVNAPPAKSAADLSPEKRAEQVQTLLVAGPKPARAKTDNASSDSADGDQNPEPQLHTLVSYLGHSPRPLGEDPPLSDRDYQMLLDLHNAEAELGTHFATAAPSVRNRFQDEVWKQLRGLHVDRQWLALLSDARRPSSVQTKIDNLKQTSTQLKHLARQIQTRTQAERLRNQLAVQLPDYARFVADRAEADAESLQSWSEVGPLSEPPNALIKRPTDITELAQTINDLTWYGQAIAANLDGESPDVEQLAVDCEKAESQWNELQQGIAAIIAAINKAPLDADDSEYVRCLELPWITADDRKTLADNLHRKIDQRATSDQYLPRSPGFRPRSEAQGAGLWQAYFATRMLDLAAPKRHSSDSDDLWNAWKEWKKQVDNGDSAGEEVFAARITFTDRYRQHRSQMGDGNAIDDRRVEAAPLANWLANCSTELKSLTPPSNQPPAFKPDQQLAIEWKSATEGTLSTATPVELDHVPPTNVGDVVLFCQTSLKDLEVMLDGTNITKKAARVPGNTFSLKFQWAEGAEMKADTLTLILGKQVEQPAKSDAGTGLDVPYAALRLNLQPFVNSDGLRIAYALIPKVPGANQPAAEITKLPPSPEVFALQPRLAGWPSAWQEKSVAVTLYRVSRETAANLLKRDTPPRSEDLEELGTAAEVQLQGSPQQGVGITFAPTKTPPPAEGAATPDTADKLAEGIDATRLLFGITRPESTRTVWRTGPEMQVMNANEIIGDIIASITLQDDVTYNQNRDRVFRVRLQRGRAFQQVMPEVGVRLDIPRSNELVDVNAPSQTAATLTEKSPTAELFIKIKPDIPFPFEIGLDVAGVRSLYRWKIDPQSDRVTAGNPVRILSPPSEVHEIEPPKPNAPRGNRNQRVMLEFHVDLPLGSSDGQWRIKYGEVDENTGRLRPNSQILDGQSRYRTAVTLKPPVGEGLLFQATAANEAREFDLGEGRARHTLRAELYGGGKEFLHEIEYGVADAGASPSVVVLNQEKLSIAPKANDLELQVEARDTIAGIQKIGYAITPLETAAADVPDKAITWIDNVPRDTDHLWNATQSWKKRLNRTDLPKPGKWQLVLVAINGTGKKGLAAETLTISEPYQAPSPQPGKPAPATTGTLIVVVPDLNVRIASSARASVSGPDGDAKKVEEALNKMIQGSQGRTLSGRPPLPFENVKPGKYTIELKFPTAVGAIVYTGEKDVQVGERAQLTLKPMK